MEPGIQLTRSGIVYPLLPVLLDDLTGYLFGRVLLAAALARLWIDEYMVTNVFAPHISGCA